MINGECSLIRSPRVAVIAIVLLLVTMVYSVIVLRNFGRGLKTSSTCITRLPSDWILMLHCSFSGQE